MSVVWKATDDVLRRPVAVKILAGDFTFDLARIAVLTEAQAVAQMSHANVCNVFDYGESIQTDGFMVPYIVMEMLTGPSLADRLKEGPLPAHEALKIAADVAAGLAAAHAHGVVHRDVKPGNVILTPSGAKVIDFGIAASAGEPEARADGTIVATPAVVAPERLRGGTVLPPSDMFSFGVLLCYLLTGGAPWPAWIPLEDRLAKVLPLPELPGVPAAIADLYLSCLAEDPEDRPTAAAAAAVLLVALTVRTPQPGDVAPRAPLPMDNSEAVTLGIIADADRRRRRRRTVILSAALVAVVIATVFAFVNRSGSSQGVLGSGPSNGPSASPTSTLPGDLPGPGVSTPGREVPVPGVTGHSGAGIGVNGGNPPAAGPVTLFNTKGGGVNAACDSFGPRIESVQAAPGFYPNQVSLVVAALVFFTKPAAGASPTITYRLTITCSGVGAVPDVTVTSYTGDKLETPSPTAPAPTTPPPSP
jgi:eukaryotic-like serine/threonine-protein kinase